MQNDSTVIVGTTVNCHCATATYVYVIVTHLTYALCSFNRYRLVATFFRRMRHSHCVIDCRTY